MEYDLVFEGGGAKGIVFVGAMQEFEEKRHVAGRLLGTSAGAITATLLAAGYTSQEMLEALREEEDGRPVFVGFMGVPGPFSGSEVAQSATMDFFRAIDLPFVPEFVERKMDAVLIWLLFKSEKYRHLFSFVERGGWYAADRFRSWLAGKLDTGTAGETPRRFSGMTLEDFHGATGKELSLVAADTTGQRILVLNHRTAPQCPIVWAVRMSMSIPLVWQEVEWKAEWGTYQGRDISGHLVVDGGMLSNFPIELFVSKEERVTAIMGEKRNQGVLGLLIDETLPVAGAPPPSAADEEGIDFSRLRTVSRLRRLVDTMTSAHDKEVIEAMSDLVVRLPAQGYGTTEFDMSEARRTALVTAGRQAMGSYFSAHELETPRDLARFERAQLEATRIATGILGG